MPTFRNVLRISRDDGCQTLAQNLAHSENAVNMLAFFSFSCDFFFFPMGHLNFEVVTQERSR